MSYTVGSLFSGIGGLDLAASWAGFDVCWQVEIDPFCRQVLARHWPNAKRYGDIYECHDLPAVDVICAGFPCQPFSVAGKRQGNKDERYLIPEMLRVIAEVKPYAVLLENVPGFPSLSDGAEFKALLQALAGLGYDAEWGHLRASDVGAPHKRERWFCVAYAQCPEWRADNLREHVARNGQERLSERTQSTSGLSQRGQALAYPSKSGLPFRKSDAWGMVSEDTRVNQSERRDIVADSASRTREFQPRQRESLRNQLTINGTEGVTRHTMAQPEFPRPSPKRVSQSRAEQVHTNHVSSPDRGRAARKRSTQSRLGRVDNGLFGGLDFPGFPAAPDQQQFDYEPPRTIIGKTDNRSKRLKALGNAVVPQVAYPLFVAIHAWLETLDG